MTAVSVKTVSQDAYLHRRTTIQVRLKYAMDIYIYIYIYIKIWWVTIKLVSLYISMDSLTLTLVLARDALPKHEMTIMFGLS